MQFSTHVSTNPLDIFPRHLNRAPLAVNAILHVDPELLVDIFINAGGAEARLRTRITGRLTPSGTSATSDLIRRWDG